MDYLVIVQLMDLEFLKKKILIWQAIRNSPALEVNTKKLLIKKTTW